MDNLTGRLKKFMKHENLNTLRFSEILGYSHSEKISRLFRKENAMPSAEILQDISYKFENLNIEWLLTGKGTMLRGVEATALEASAHSPCPELLAENNLLKDNIIKLEADKKHLQTTITHLQTTIENQQRDKNFFLEVNKELEEAISDYKSVIEELQKRPRKNV